jgi:hypothetical protein
MYEESYLNTHNARMKLGMAMPTLNTAKLQSGETVGLTNAIFDELLGLAYGLQYDKSKKSQCYSSIELYFINFDYILTLFTEIYNPANWALL